MLSRTPATTSESSVNTPSRDGSDSPRDTTNVRSAALWTFRFLPRNNKQKVQVWGHIARRLMREEATKDVFMDELNTITNKEQTVTHFTQMGLCKQLTELSGLYKELVRMRAARKFNEVPKIATAIKAKYSFRQAARALHVPFTTSMRMCSVPKQVATKGRNVTTTQKDAVTNFVQRDDVSMRLPYKCQARNIYMRSAIMPVYKQYCKEQEMLGCHVLSLSSFYKAMPKCVKYMHDVPFRTCLCEDCLNFSLLIDALHAAQLSGIPRRMTSVVLMTLCMPSGPQVVNSESVTIGDCEHDCIFRVCKKCGARMVEVVND